jgi:hypothetical protein
METHIELKKLKNGMIALKTNFPSFGARFFNYNMG